MEITDQSNQATITPCFESCLDAHTLDQTPILMNNFITHDQKSVKLILYSNCILMTQDDLPQPKNSARIFIFNKRCSFETVTTLTDESQKHPRIRFFMEGDRERREFVYCLNNQICEKWNDVLVNYLNKRGFSQDYDLLEFIGKGHSCSVYKARLIQTQEIVAVKVFERNNGLRSQQAFLNEIQILRAINHPNILRLHASYLETNHIYAVTEYCSGGSLYTEVTTKSNISQDEKTRVIVHLTNAVEYLRSLKIVHRDIKLENIFIKRQLNQQTYVLGDFGLAVHLDEKVPIFNACGTVGYAAPEILRHPQNKPVALNHKIDTFPLGAIFHIILLKRTVFQHKPGDIKELTQLNKRCFINWKQDFYLRMPKDQLELLQCTLTENPQNRFTTKQILSLPFFKKLERQCNQIREQSDCKSNSTRPNSNHSTVSPKSSLPPTASLKNIFAQKSKMLDTPKVKSAKKWSILSWFKHQQKENSSSNPTDSFRLEDCFIQQKNSKQRFCQEF